MTEPDSPIPDSELPELEDGQFPPDVRTDEERRRFRMAWGVADKIFGEDGPAAVWQAARSKYRSDLPT